MKHVIYFNGNKKKIAWVIQTKKKIIKQQRKHVPIYLNNVNYEQSKIIALHIGIFWGIGKFMIKNNDELEIMIDSICIYKILLGDIECNDNIIIKRIEFIKQLIKKRELNITYKLINKTENLVYNIEQ